MEHSKFSKRLLVADLSVCCIWLLCLINSNPNGYGVLPMFCIGYNPYSVLEARKIRHFDEYEYSYNGLMLVKGRDGIGIRDRYELILPAEYCDVELLKSHKPYCKVQ